MGGYITEEQQLEALKLWWKKYGWLSVITFLVVLAIGFGIRHWQLHKEKMLEHASGRYELLLTGVVNNDTAAAEYQATRLMKRYPQTSYAQLAALMLARQEVHAGKLDLAEEKLKWVMQKGTNKSLRQIARIRLARVLLEQQKQQPALDILQKVDDKAFTAAVEEVRGDILLAMGKTEAARAAYLAAAKAFPGLEVARPILEMKINDVATAPQ